MNIIGDVSGRRCILFDDIVDSAGTLVNAANALKERGADRGLRLRQPRRALGAGHGAGLGLGPDRAGHHRLHRAARARSPRCDKVRTVAVAPLIGEAIRRIANEESVSKLFD